MSYGPKNVLNGVAGLDGSGLINQSVIPPTIPFSKITNSVNSVSVGGNIAPTVNYTRVLSDGLTLNLPLGSAVKELAEYTIQNIGATTTIIGVQGSDLINGSLTSVILGGNDSSITFRYTSSSWNIVNKNLCYTSVSISNDFEMSENQVMVVQSADARAVQLPSAAKVQPEDIFTIKLTGSALNLTIGVPPGESLDGTVNSTHAIVATANGFASFRISGTAAWRRVG